MMVASAAKLVGILVVMAVDGGHFTSSEVCERCHANAPGATAMRDGKGREVSQHRLWSGTQMANSFRDVVWRAVVSAEMAANPAHADEVARTCRRCHAPMDATGASDLSTGPSGLAVDGVSCTVCHRITGTGEGRPETFSGRFTLSGEAELYGPHDDLFARPMVHHSGFEPVQGSEIRRSSLCATCHTLHTAALRPDGSAVGDHFLEQAPYLEWRNSAFNDERDGASGAAASCQACHAPVRDADGEAIESRIARNPGGRDFPPTDPRSPFGRHLFVGGNTLVPRLLASGETAIPPAATREALEATAEAAAAQLAGRTARLQVEGVRRSARKLAFGVRVENLTGHKFPTGHPARRAWLRVRVLDADGKVLFASGEHDRAGRILDGRGRPLATEMAGGGTAPHRAVVRAPGEVPLYELAMADEAGAATHALLRAVRAAKDDRLLPIGWASDHPDAAATRPVGVDRDADFVAGRDTVRYEILLPRGARPARVEATLLYQTLGARYAAELFEVETTETRALAAMLARVGNEPALVVRDEAPVR